MDLHVAELEALKTRLRVLCSLVVNHSDSSAEGQGSGDATDGQRLRYGALHGINGSSVEIVSNILCCSELRRVSCLDGQKLRAAGTGREGSSHKILGRG